MKITIKWTDLKPIESIEVFVEEKIGGLEKFLKYLGTAVEAWVEVSRTTKHHKRGEFVYRAEADIRLPNKIVRAEAIDKDLRLAIVRVKDELQQQIKTYKGSKEAKTKRGARLAKKMTAVAPEAFTSREWKFGKREKDEGI